MGRNTDFKTKLENFRRRLYRSSHGKLLGVFSGIAESLGYGVCKTRWVGVILLVILASELGAKGLGITAIVGGFFYMLVALLMQPPRPAGSRLAAEEADEDLIPPPLAARRWSSFGQETPIAPRVDLAQLDRQLESLNRRIQRMETIVTDRQYDWDRRMDT